MLLSKPDRVQRHLYNISMFVCVCVFVHLCTSVLVSLLARLCYNKVRDANSCRLHLRGHLLALCLQSRMQSLSHIDAPALALTPTPTTLTRIATYTHKVLINSWYLYVDSNWTDVNALQRNLLPGLCGNSHRNDFRGMSAHTVTFKTELYLSSFLYTPEMMTVSRTSGTSTHFV